MTEWLNAKLRQWDKSSGNICRILTLTLIDNCSMTFKTDNVIFNFFFCRVFIQVIPWEESPMLLVIPPPMFWHFWPEKLMLHYIYNIVMYFEPDHHHKLKISILKLATLLRLLLPIKSVMVKMILNIITNITDPEWSTVGVLTAWTWASPIWTLFMRHPNLLQYPPKKTYSPFKWFPMTNRTRPASLPSHTMRCPCWIACSMPWISNKNKKRHLMTFSLTTTTGEFYKTLFMLSVGRPWTSQSRRTWSTRIMPKLPIMHLINLLLISPLYAQGN